MWGMRMRDTAAKVLVQISLRVCRPVNVKCFQQEQKETGPARATILNDPAPLSKASSIMVEVLA
jgi:hypothetical protein